MARIWSSRLERGRTAARANSSFLNPTSLRSCGSELKGVTTSNRSGNSYVSCPVAFRNKRSVSPCRRLGCDELHHPSLSNLTKIDPPSTSWDLYVSRTSTSALSREGPGHFPSMCSLIGVSDFTKQLQTRSDFSNRGAMGTLSGVGPMSPRSGRQLPARRAGTAKYS